MAETHECREADTCCCSVTALEPNEECPVHGSGPWPPRCAACGRFLPMAVRAEKLEAPDAHP